MPVQYRRAVSQQRGYTAQKSRGRQAHTVRDLYGRLVTYNRAPAPGAYYGGGHNGAGQYPPAFLAQEVEVAR